MGQLGLEGEHLEWVRKGESQVAGCGRFVMAHIYSLALRPSASWLLGQVVVDPRRWFEAGVLEPPALGHHSIAELRAAIVAAAEDHLEAQARALAHI
jgi:hypothetical protein